MPQPQLNLAQIDMMVRTIHSLKDEAEHVSIMTHQKPHSSAPQLIITSRPRTAPPSEQRGTSADIISIMDRISVLAADGEQEDKSAPDISEPDVTENTIPDIGSILQHIQALADEADEVTIEPVMDNEPDISEAEPTDAPVLEPRKLEDNPLDADDVDAAMQDIETAVRKAAPAPETAPEAQEPGQMSDRLADVIRDEVRTVLKNELPDAVRSIVHETLKSEGIVAPTREKIRTRRFRNS